MISKWCVLDGAFPFSRGTCLWKGSWCCSIKGEISIRINIHTHTHTRTESPLLLRYARSSEDESSKVLFLLFFFSSKKNISRLPSHWRRKPSQQAASFTLDPADRSYHGFNTHTHTHTSLGMACVAETWHGAHGYGSKALDSIGLTGSLKKSTVHIRLVVSSNRARSSSPSRSNLGTRNRPSTGAGSAVGGEIIIIKKYKTLNGCV